MDHKQHRETRLWKRTMEKGMKTYECVGYVKQYVIDRGWAKLWYFGWSAKEWWKNTNKTFGPEYQKVLNTAKNFPVQGDIIFFKNMWFETLDDGTVIEHGHTAIVHSADVNQVMVMEQNWGLWKWNGLWTDSIRDRVYNYEDILGWYHYTKGPIVELPEWQILIDKGIFNWTFDAQITTRLAIMLTKMYKDLKSS